MKLERSKAWWIAKAALEGHSSIGAGGGATGDVSHGAANADEERIAFGMFVTVDVPFVILVAILCWLSGFATAWFVR